LSANPAALKIHELNVVQPAAAQARKYFAPGFSRIVTAQENRVERHDIAVDVPGDKNAVTDRFHRVQLQVNGTWIFLRATHPRPQDIVRGAAVFDAHRFSVVFEDRGRRSLRPQRAANRKPERQK